MEESEWYGIHVCVKCEKRLDRSQKRYNEGICPKCGHETKDESICDTRIVVVKEIKHHKWWQFWKKKFTYIGKDEFSQRWLDKN